MEDWKDKYLEKHGDENVDETTITTTILQPDCRMADKDVYLPRVDCSISVDLMNFQSA